MTHPQSEHPQLLQVALLGRLSGGGSTTSSGGVVYAGGGTPILPQAGEIDSVDNLFSYLQQEVQGAVSDVTLLNFCESSVGNLAWLESHDARYDATAYKHKRFYPLEGCFLCCCGNETAAAFRHKAEPVRRGHRTKGKGLTGSVFLPRCALLCQKNNIHVKTTLKCCD